MFCAPNRRFESRTALETSLSAVKGGQMTMSISLMLPSSRLRSSISASASATVLFIFQLPATINLRCFSMKKETAAARLLVLELDHAGQRLPLEEFKARPAARAHKSPRVAQVALIEGLDAVAPADDADGALVPGHVGYRARDGKRAFGKTGVLEHSHRAVPEDRPGFRNHLAVLANGFW